MTILTQGRRGRFRLERSPEDNLAPYRCLFTLPDGRRYSGRLRSHPDNRGAGYWYEGFVSAFNPIAHARDEELKRYPSRPPAEPERWDLMPTQIKLNPYPRTVIRITCEPISLARSGLPGRGKERPIEAPYIPSGPIIAITPLSSPKDGWKLTGGPSTNLSTGIYMEKCALSQSAEPVRIVATGSRGSRDRCISDGMPWRSIRIWR